MNIELGDTGVSLGDVADAGKAASSLTKSLPGMTKKDDDGSAEPDKCSTCSQKIVTTQPGDAVGDAMNKAEDAANCCNKLFDCFGKGMDAVDKVQSVTGEA